MLGTRTKQVYSYGKRNQRIVNVSEERDRRKAVPNIFDDMDPAPPLAPLVSKMKRRENAVLARPRTPSPKVIRISRKKRLSPTLSPAKKRTRVAQIIESEAHKQDSPVLQPKAKHRSLKENTAPTTPRAPLAHFPVNLPGSPAVMGRPRGGRIPSAKGTPLKLNKPFSPFVDVDIMVLDNEGRTLRQERRVSRTDVEANPIIHPVLPQPNHLPRGKRSLGLADVIDDDIEFVEKLRPPKRSARRTVVYSDDSDSEDEANPLPPVLPKNAFSSQSKPPALLKAGSSQLLIEVVIPPAPYRLQAISNSGQAPRLPQVSATPSPPQSPAPLLAHPHYQYISSPVTRPRQLTPIRRGGRRTLFEPPSPPSPTLTDIDLSLYFEELNITGSSSGDDSSLPEPEIPEYLRPLLEECHQESCGPIEFSSFIETFPFDPVVQSDGNSPHDSNFRKIGEASYSEVFGIGNVVLKVIPLRDETAAAAGRAQVRQNNNMEEEDGPAPSDAKDVLKEMIVTRAMGEVCDGFVKLLKTYIVRGKYPEVLLRLWDEYDQKKGSESVRPDKFLVSQVYAIIVLPNGGPDLEAYKFVNASKMGWRQACSLFWQVAKSLAHAEQLVSFEHRDLHWGQILVKNLQMPAALPLRTRNPNSRSTPKAPRIAMDDPTHGVQATLIDLGLSRMDAGDGAGGEKVHWTPFDDEVFMGEGDYQFDVYRIMKEHNGGEWDDFNPVTNVMWLHYLARKLLHSKNLKPPPASRSKSSNETAAFTEKDCYDCLIDIDRWLGQCLASIAPTQTKSGPKSTGRRKTQAPLPSKPLPSPSPSCAGEIVVYAVKKGWIKPTSS
ncbi:Serine/threonine-protein kinase haspin hrk1 [Hypsizygus marmoreus]|uniref:non-specific serine/threonine protein kinase n=1 Tax=Hypsizygus marmoreus TaxID=39966 RepID=A0A369JJN7_HYPMA|nr:Serine/threonine-protein kinase haspin hrk1 [Hypsizygus marmoreus]